MSLPVKTRQKWIGEASNYSIRRQCKLAGISRKFNYYENAKESPLNVELMRLMDEQY
jgi:putative transposase